MQEITMEAKSVAQAIEQGLKELGLRRDQVEVTILQEPSAGILGLGAKPARVLLREKLWMPEGVVAPPPQSEAPSEAARPPVSEATGTTPAEPERPPSIAREMPAPPRPRQGGGARGARRFRDRWELGERGPRRTAEVAEGVPAAPYTPQVPATQNQYSQQAKNVLEELLRLMQLGEFSVLAGWDEVQERVRAEVVSPQARSLIGQDASTLEALQLLTTLIVNRRLKSQVVVQVDAEGYWHRLEERVVAQARRGVEEVKRTGRPYRLDPMDAALRRLVHRTLAGDPDVETVSEGDGPWRKVVLKPRNK